MTASPSQPTVFISYSHDCDTWQAQGLDPATHIKRVFDLAERLRAEGVECVIDQHVASPPEGWPRWMMDNIEGSHFVLVVATEVYNRRFRGHGATNQGFGAQWEGAIITQELYEANGKNKKFLPIIFDSDDARHIPLPLRSATFYNVSDQRSYDSLYYYITNQPPPVRPLGSMRRRPAANP